MRAEVIPAKRGSMTSIWIYPGNGKSRILVAKFGKTDHGIRAKNAVVDDLDRRGYVIFQNGVMIT